MPSADRCLPSHHFSSNHVQRLLSRKPADSFAIAGEIAFYHLSSAFAGQRVKDEADRFVWGTACGSGHAGDAYTESRATTLADSSAMAFATSALTAPYFLMRSGGTAANFVFSLLE